MNALPHLMIADALWHRLEWPLPAQAHILLGAIAPDSYRVAPQLSYRDLHFRSHRQPGQRMADFLELYLQPALQRRQPEEQAFWVGWLSHIVADGVWRRMVRSELPLVWAACSGHPRAERTHMRKQYRAACDRVDRMMAYERPEYVSGLQWFLRSVVPAYPCPLVDAATLTTCARRTADREMPPPEPDRESNLVKYAFVTRAMNAAIEEALAVVSEQLARAVAGGDRA